MKELVVIKEEGGRGKERDKGVREREREREGRKEEGKRWNMVKQIWSSVYECTSLRVSDRVRMNKLHRLESLGFLE